ncbi:hypothetical protein JCM11251_001164 [Rhodosporidiobolus azoricus]
MGRPSAADVLAFQLEQAHSSRPSNSPLSAPASSSFGSPSSVSSAPTTPGTTWTPATIDSHQFLHSALRKNSMPATVSGYTGLGISGIEHATRPNLAGRVATRPVTEEEEGVEETDDELEDELNDFGYGARPRSRKERKESLMDILNSEPPEWMNRPPPSPSESPVATPLTHSRSTTFGQKILSRFTSSTNSSPASDDPQAAFSTLRTSRSAGNLLGLGSLRKNSSPSSALPRSQNGSYSLSASASKRSLLNQKHSRDNLSLSGFTSTSHLPPCPASPAEFQGISETRPPFSTSLTFSTSRGAAVDEFGRRPQLSSAPNAFPVPKLSAKDASFASSAGESTRALADFLRSSAPPGENPYPLQGRGRENSASSSLNSSGSGRYRSSSLLHRSRRSLGGGGSGGNSHPYGQMEDDRGGRRDSSIDTDTTSATAKDSMTQNANIVIAAMVKLGGAGRRASLTAFSPGMMFSSSTTSGIAGAAASVTATQKSENGTGDKRVDATLLDGLFGVVPSASGGAGRSRPSVPPTMGVRDFVEHDELLHRRPTNSSSYHTSTAPNQPVAGLPVVSRAGELCGTGRPMPSPYRSPPPKAPSVNPYDGTAAGPGGLARSDSMRSEASFGGFGSPTSPRHQKKLSRKPVPAAIPPVEELLLSASTASASSRSSPASDSPTRKPVIRDETLAGLIKLQQDRGDTSPLAMGESPIKGFDGLPSTPTPKSATPSGLVAPATPVTASAPATPTSPTTSAYSTPPITALPSATIITPSLNGGSGTSTNKASKRLSLIGSTDPCPVSPPPESPLPAPPTSSSTASVGVLVRPATQSSLGQAAKKLSTVPASPPARSAPLADAHEANVSTDSFIDPPLPARLPRDRGQMASDDGREAEEPIGHEHESERVRVNKPLLLALEALRESMRATADLPLPFSVLTGALAGESTEEVGQNQLKEQEDLVAGLLPTLRRMREQMELGASLLGALLAHIEREPHGMEGKRVEVDQEREREGDEEVACVAEALLDADELTRPADESSRPQKDEEDKLHEKQDEAIEENSPIRVGADKAPTVDFHRLSTLDAGQGFSGFVQALSM